MEHAATFSQALNSLQTTRAVTLPGAPATWSQAIRVLFTVLLVLVPFVAVGGLIFVVIAALSGAQITGGTVIAVIMVMFLLAGVMAVLLVARRRQRANGERERLDVQMGPQGLTLRGVGPIPWQDFGPAQHELVPSEHNSGYTRRAVMRLTRSGVYNVNQRLAPHLRERVCPATGPMWNHQHYWVYVPGIEGMSQSEVMQLINMAHSLFAGTHYAGR